MLWKKYWNIYKYMKIICFLITQVCFFTFGDAQKRLSIIYEDMRNKGSEPIIMKSLLAINDSVSYYVTIELRGEKKIKGTAGKSVYNAFNIY